ncbi:MAG TPA: hypothetical protein VFA27_05320 [Vicinamibacterales bacterium]|nr:hypothetical protein [Vicinamibacterales bacterium]
MAKKPMKQVKKSQIPAGDLGAALYALSQEIKGVAEELHPLWHVEELADNVGNLIAPLDALATAAAMKVIAEYGSEDDRSAVVAYLTRRYLND